MYSCRPYKTYDLNLLLEYLDNKLEKAIHEIDLGQIAKLENRKQEIKVIMEMYDKVMYEYSTSRE